MSIIFAAISSNLIVELKLMNGSNSDGNKLNVAFSNTISLDGSREIYGYPSKYTTSPATIKNLENPMIVGLNAHFTEPGQSVTYSFYILNSGAYDAFLQEIIYGTLDSNGQFKSCSTKGLDDNRMDVCNFIDVSLDIGTDLNKVKANDSKYVSDHILKI